MTTEVYRPSDWNLLRPGPGGALPDDAAYLTTVAGVRDLIAWGRGNSVWPLTFGLACCAIEMMAFASTRYDVDRMGCGAFRATPRQADLMITAGTVTYKMAHRVRRLWEQMPEPKWVIAMGACTVGGGPYSKWGYHVVQGVDLVIPVDVHVPGCPPRPEALIDGLMKLQKIIQERGSLDQQASIAEAVRQGQADLIKGIDPGTSAHGVASGGAPRAGGRIVVPGNAPSLKAPSLKAPALKAPPLPGGAKPAGAPKLPGGFKAPATAPKAPSAPSAPTAPTASTASTAPASEQATGPVDVSADAGGGHPPTQLKASGPLPPAVFAANRDKPSGPPQPYVPIHKR